MHIPGVITNEILLPMLSVNQLQRFARWRPAVQHTLH